MRECKLLLTGLCVIAVAGLMSCAQQPKSANSGQAIEEAKKLPAVEDQVKYLVKEANAFINSQKFDEAVSTAKYILANLDQNSVEAQSILEKAKAQLEAMAKKKVEEVKGNLKDKIGSLGQ